MSSRAGSGGGSVGEAVLSPGSARVACRVWFAVRKRDMLLFLETREPPRVWRPVRGLSTTDEGWPVRPIVEPAEGGAQHNPPSATSVYRYYDVHEMLIYAGITDRGVRRNLEHGKAAEWWPYVVRQEVEHLASRADALAREKELIQQFRPPFNVIHNVEHEALRAAYLAFAQSSVDHTAPKEIGHRLNHRLPLVDVGRTTLRTTAEHFPLARCIVLQEGAEVRCHTRWTGVTRMELRGLFLVIEIGRQMPPQYTALAAKVRCTAQRRNRYELEKIQFQLVSSRTQRMRDSA